MIDLKNLKFSYDGQKNAVEELNISCQPGEVFGLLGPNGAGKTTTLKMLTGILKPTAGEVHINGINLQENPLEAKRQFAFVPDDPNVFPRLTGLEYLRFIADIYEVPESVRQERLERLTSLFQIKEALGNRLSTYSHGMRQKVILAGALIHDPPVWILDEPMTGLDPRSAYNLKELMQQHKQEGKLVLFSTHVLEVAEKLCDRLAIIHQGRILFVGTMQQLRGEFKQDSSLEKIFLELTERDPDQLEMA